MDSRWTERNDRRSPYCLLLLQIVALLLCLARAQIGLGSPPTDFHLDAGDATLTLNEFSRQAGLQLLFDFSVVRGRTTQAVNGIFEPREALRRMLANTGLVFDFVNERTLAVTPLKVASAAGTAQAPAAPRAKPRSGSEQTVEQVAGTANLAPGGFNALETVRVTGTNLRGEAPVGAEVITIDHHQIEDSGATTVADLLGTQSQIFGGGPTQDTRIVADAQTNSGYGTAINLRGLGARATLVLLNGRRLAPGGTDGAFVDIMDIPISAVEKIDVLPDSASALYGADAVGGVVNFIMRDNFCGSETLLDKGAGAGGALKSDLVSQTLGHKWESGTGMVSLEYYRRDSLAAGERPYANSDLRPFGGDNFDIMLSNPATLLAGGVTYAIPPHQDGTHLSPASLVPGTQNLQNKFLDADIVPQQQRISLYSSGRRNFDGDLSLFASALLVERQASERGSGFLASLSVPPTNPFAASLGALGPAAVLYNFVDDLGPTTTDVTVKTSNITVGADYAAGASWFVHAYAALARERNLSDTRGIVDIAKAEAALADPDPATALNPFGDGSHTNPRTLRSITTPSLFRLDSQLEVADISADGSLLKLPGGDLKLAMGLDRRDQFYYSALSASALGAVPATNLSRLTTAAFGEVVLPLFGQDNARPGLRKLEISAAARYEDYEGFGHATTPKFGLNWSPAPGLSFRGTIGKSIRAPSLTDLDDSKNTVIPETLPDPASPTGQTAILVLAGNNPSLKEERARSWTAGIDFTPQRLKDLTIGLTWFNIDFSDRIQDTDFSADALSNPRFALLVTRSPGSELVDYVCTHSLLVFLTQTQCLSLGANGAILDLRTRNVETLRTQGVDFAVKYRRDLYGGELKLEASGTYLTDYSLAEGAGSPDLSALNTAHNPVNLRLRSALGWRSRRFGWDTAVNYTNSYRDTTSVPNRPVAAWVTVDAQVHYELDRNEGGWLDGVRLSLTGTNLFNRDPPFLNNGIVGLGYDQENADPYGRLISVQLRKKW
jgi:iron complex outermembrane receptor protein